MAQILAQRPSVLFAKQRAKSQIRFKKIPQSIVIIFATSLVVIVLLAFVWKSLQCTYLGYQIGSLENQLQQSVKLHNELVVEYEMLRSVKRVDQIAKNTLGMVPAKFYGQVTLNN